MDPASIINRAMQLNPNNWRFWKSRGYVGRPIDWAVLIGATQVPAVKWLETLSNLNALAVLAQHSANTLTTCVHGVTKVCCYLCSLKGLVVLIPALSVAVLYWYYPKKLKEYAIKGYYGTGTLCQSSARFVTDNAVFLADYSWQYSKYYVWYYGVIVPYRAIKSGVISTGNILASQIGYYCGLQTTEEPRKCDD